MDPIARARLNASLRDLLSELLARRVRDPRVEPVTLTSVEVSRDLSVAKVFYSVLGDEDVQRTAQRGLENVAGFLRGEAGRRMRLRTIPQLRFHFDASLERGQRIEQLLRELHDDAPLPPDFVCAHDLAPQDHIAMLAALQPLVDGGIAKTVNVAADADDAAVGIVKVDHGGRRSVPLRVGHDLWLPITIDIRHRGKGRAEVDAQHNLVFGCHARSVSQAMP